MKIYFDESRNTGEIGVVSDRLNYFEQRYFVLVGYVGDDSITNKYVEFKQKWIKKINIDDEKKLEIKGNDLVTKKNNEPLNEFINTFFKNDNFYITIYDKKFFLITQFLNWLFLGLKDYDFSRYHSYVLFFQKVNEGFLAKYLYITKNNTMDNVHAFIEFIKQYPFYECISSPLEARILQDMRLLIQELEVAGGLIEFLYQSNVENIKIKKSDRNNIVNLTALGETILMMKYNNKKLTNKDIIIYHHQIELVQDYIKHYWKHTRLEFVESIRSNEVQLVDNVSSILGNLISKILPLNSDSDIENLLSCDFKWIRNTLRKILTSLSQHNIKMVISMREAALIKSYISEKNFVTLYEFKQDLLNRLDNRFHTEMNNHLSESESNELLKK